MSKINIKLMSDVAFETLRKNIESYVQYFLDNPTDSSWINTITDEKTFDIKKYQIEDFELKIPSSSVDRKTDLENAIILYEHLNGLPGYILSEPRFWLWLMFEKGYQTALNSMEKIDATSFRHQWLFVDGLRRGLFFGVLSRLYFRVELTYSPENHDDPYYLTKYVMDNPLRFREITWRAISNYRFVVKSMLKAEIRANKTFEFEEKGIYFSALAKEICKLGSIKLIDAMSEEYVEEYIYKKYINIIQTDIYTTNLNDYNDALDYMSKGTEKDLKKAIKLFQNLDEFMDAKEMLLKCQDELAKIKPKKSLFNFLKSKK